MNSLARMKNDRKSIATKVSSIIDEAEYMRNSYFWSPPSSSSSRRWYEKQHSYPETCWEEGGNSYSARFDVACSCRNIYASGTYTKNDTKTNLAAIRSSLERMERSLNLHEEYSLWRKIRKIEPEDDKSIIKQISIIKNSFFNTLFHSPAGCYTLIIRMHLISMTKATYHLI